MLLFGLYLLFGGVLGLTITSGLTSTGDGGLYGGGVGGLSEIFLKACFPSNN